MQVEVRRDWEALQGILAGLPLDGCNLEKCPITLEQGWHAPKNHAFRIGGQFMVQSTDSDVSFWIQPQDSKDLFLVKNSEHYEDVLRQAKGDEAEALELLVEHFEDYDGEYQLPEIFDGKWLVVDTRLNKEGILEGIGLRVKQEVHAWYETRYFMRISGITPDDEKVTPCTFDSPEGVIQWQQLYAEAVLGSAKVEMIEVEDPKPQLFIPKTQAKTAIEIPMICHLMTIP